jgi:hypothetical protein
MLLQSYDVGHDARGRSDQTTQSYTMNAPIILDGEDALQDAAILERAVIVSMDPLNIAYGSPAHKTFAELSERSGELHKIAGRYIQYTLKQSVKDIFGLWVEAQHTMHDVLPATTPDRVRRNLVTTWFGIEQYLSFLDAWKIPTERPDPAVLLEPVAAVVNTSMGRTLTATDDFIIDVINEVALSKTQRSFFFHYEESTNILWFQLTTAFGWWLRKLRSENRPAMTLPAVKAELKQRNCEIGGGSGQYIMGPLARNEQGTKWMYGILLEKCVEAGLDVPYSIVQNVLVWTFQDTRREANANNH